MNRQVHDLALARRIVEALEQHAITPDSEHQPKISDFLKYDEPEEKIAKPLCAKRIERQEQGEYPAKVVAQCLDCGLCPNSIVCLACFAKSNHEGHRFKMIRANGGSCDCGDAQVWKKEGFCSDHSGCMGEVSIPETEKEKFLVVWRSLFSRLFAKECPVANNSKAATLLAKSYCEFLNQLADKSVYFCKMVTLLMESEISFRNPQTGKQEVTPLIDLILTQILTNQLAQLYVELFIVLSTYSVSKELLLFAYIRNYQTMFKNSSDSYLALGCQLFTHQDLINEMRKKNIFLTVNNLEGKEDVLEKISRHVYNLGYIVHSKDAGRQYWRSYFESDHSLEEIAAHWEALERSWSNDYSDKTLLDYFAAEKHLLTVVGKVCMTIKNPALLDKAGFSLLRFIEKEVSNVKNKCFLPLHRMLAIAVFVTANFEVNNSTENKWLRDMLTKDVCTLLLKPVMQCVAFNNKLLHRANLRIHYQSFCKRYTEGSERIYAYDVLLIKMVVLASPESIDPISLLPKMVHALVEHIQQPSPNESQEERLERKVQSLLAFADVLAFFCQLTLSDCEELYLREELFKNSDAEPSTLTGVAEDVIASFLTCVKQCSIEDVRKVAKWLLHPQMPSLIDILKKVSIYDARTQRFSGKNVVKSFNFDYLFDRVELLKLVQGQNRKPQYTLEGSLPKRNQIIFSALVSEGLLQYCRKVLQYAQDNRSSGTVGALNSIWVQLCKLYEIGSKCEGYNNLNQIEELLKIEWVRTHLFPDSLACLPSKFSNVVSGEDSQASPKRDVKEIQRRRMEQMRLKQQSFAKTISEKLQVQQEETPAVSENCCNICKLELDKSLVAYPIGIQLSNLSGLAKHQSNPSEPCYSLERLGKEDVIEVTRGLVLSRCTHIFHLECLMKTDLKHCSICKRKCDTFLVNSNQSIPSDISRLTLAALWKATNPGLSAEEKSINSLISLVANSVVESVEYQGTLWTDSFVKTRIRIYRDLVHIAIGFIRSLESEQKEPLEKFLLQEIKCETASFVRRAVDNALFQVFFADQINLLKIFETIKDEAGKDDRIILDKQEALLCFIFHSSTSNTEALQQQLDSLPKPEQPERRLQFRPLPADFSPLYNFRKNCPKCQLLNTKICVCLMCNWMGCSGCKNGGSLSEHASICHANTCLFLWLELGKFVVMSTPRVTIAGIAYCNEFGEGVNVMNKNLDEYKLNNELYLKVQRIIEEGEAPSYIDQNYMAGRETFDSANM